MPPLPICASYASDLAGAFLLGALSVVVVVLVVVVGSRGPRE
jgi:hypothetical protein